MGWVADHKTDLRNWGGLLAIPIVTAIVMLVPVALGVFSALLGVFLALMAIVAAWVGLSTLLGAVGSLGRDEQAPNPQVPGDDAPVDERFTVWTLPATIFWGALAYVLVRLVVVAFATTMCAFGAESSCEGSALDPSLDYMD